MKTLTVENLSAKQENSLYYAFDHRANKTFFSTFEDFIEAVFSAVPFITESNVSLDGEHPRKTEDTIDYNKYTSAVISLDSKRNGIIIFQYQE